MRWTVTLASVLACASVASAEEILRHISWADLHKAGGLTRMEVVGPDDNTPFDRVEVVNPHNEKVTMTLLSVNDPGITGALYALTGKVRYQRVEGKGYLEMWSEFPDGKRHFSRTVGSSGPTQSIQGSSDWRPFVLPFHIVKGDERPHKLVMNVVFRGRGTVEVGPVSLRQYAKGLDPLVAPGDALSEFSWTKLHQAGGLPRVELVHAESKVAYERLKVTNPTDETVRMTILCLDDPKVTHATYALAGMVRCDRVAGQGYLEMLNVFPNGKRYFTRTLGRGPLEPLSGSSGWRRFVLPFYITKTKDRPERLVVNVVLPGRGTVEVSTPVLIQYAAGEDPMAMPGQWWSDRAGGVVGGVLGALVGCLGGLIGWLGSRGVARGFVIGAIKALSFFGVCALAIGVVAVIRSQPYAVYYPLLVGGALCAAIPLGCLGRIRKRYEEIELRRMTALDAT